MASEEAIDRVLAGFPDILSADDLAALTGFNRNSIYVRSARAKAGRAYLLPPVFTIPGSPNLVFLKEEVRKWLVDAQDRPPVKRGRPKGSISRRGAGRVELEART